MNRRIQDGYIYLTAVILFVTAVVKLFSAIGSAPILDWLDPLLPFSNRHVFVLAAAMELGLSIFLCLGNERGAKIASIAWLSAVYLIYRLGLWWAGAPSLCHCLGNLSDKFPITPLVLDRIAWVLLGWLSVGSFSLLTIEWFRNYKMTAVSNRPRDRQQSAFTLIELLVVIAIIGILAAMLLPALSKSKNKAIQLVDINNLKQQAIATHMFANDNGDVLPWPNWYAGDATNRQGWLYTLDTSATGSARFKVETGTFWDTLRSPKMYMCPMDDTNAPLFAKRDQKISSYAMNGAVIGYNRTNFPPEKLENMLPTDIAFWETDERYPGYFNDGANYPKEGVSTRHLQGAIRAAFGGDVSFIRFDTWYFQVTDPNKNNLWCYPGSPDGR